MKMIYEEKYLDVVEVSETIDLSTTTVRNYMRNGRISAKKIGAGWYANEKDIQSYLISGKTGKSGSLIMEESIDAKKKNP